MSENKHTIEYYTSSFTVLADALQSIPTNFPLSDVLDKVKPSLLQGWRIFEQGNGNDSNVTKPRDQDAFKRFQKDHSKFLSDMAERLVNTDGTQGTSSEVAYQAMQNYILTENPDRFRLNSEGIDHVVSFYHLERYRIIECTTSLVRLCVPSGAEEIAPETIDKAKNTLQWLLDHGLENNMLELLKQTAALDEEALSRKYGARSMGLVEQRLQEEASVLDLLFMLYYHQPPGKDSLLRIFKFLAGSNMDFGMALERLTNLSVKGKLAISRISSLSALIAVECFNLESLHDTHDSLDSANEDNTTASILDSDTRQQIGHILSGISGQGVHSVVMLAWAACLNYLTEDNDSDFPLAYKLQYAEQGLRNRGLEELSHMVDIHDSQYAFRGHEDNRGGYQRVALGLLTGLLALFNVERVPFWVIEMLVQCSRGVLEDDEALAQHFVEELASSPPWNGLIDYLCHLFPHNTLLLRLLATICISEEVTRFVFGVVDEQSTYCCTIPRHMMHNETTVIGKGVFRLLCRYEDPTTHVVIPEYTEGVILSDKETSNDVLVVMQFDVCGWKVLLSQMQILIRSITAFTASPHEPSTLNCSSQVVQAVSHLLELVHRSLISVDMVHLLDVYLADMLADDTPHAPEEVETEHGGGIGSLVFLLLTRLCGAGTCAYTHHHIITRCLRTVGALASFFPAAMAAQLVRLVQQDHLTRLLQEVECVSGNYEGTLAVVDAITAVAENHPHPMKSVHTVLVPYVSGRIFAVHDGWRYRRLEHRWSLARGSLRLFNSVAKTAFWDDPDERGLLMAFLEDQSLYQMLFSVVGFGSSYLTRVMAHDKTEEALIVQDLIQNALCFLNILLQFSIARTNTAFSTPFEDVLLSRLIGKKQVPLIAAVFEFIDYAYSQDVRLAAARVVTLITRLTEHYHPRPPSLVGYLGPQASSLVGRCLFRLQRLAESQELRIAIFELIASAVESQRGLANLFLIQSPPHVSLSSPIASDQTITTSNQAYSNDNHHTLHGKKLPSGGVIELVLSIIKDIRINNSQDARELYRALSILRSVFQSGEHQGLVDTIRRHSHFYKGIVDVLSHVDGISKHDQDPFFDLNTFLVRAVYCAVDIGALDVFTLNTEQRTVIKAQRPSPQPSGPTKAHNPSSPYSGRSSGRLGSHSTPSPSPPPTPSSSSSSPSSLSHQSSPSSSTKQIPENLQSLLTKQLGAILETGLQEVVTTEMVEAVDAAAQQVHIAEDLHRYIATNDVGSEDRLYDTDRMQRWLSHLPHGKACIQAACTLNTALCGAEARLSLLHAIHSMLAAVHMVPSSMPQISIAANTVLDTVVVRALQDTGRQRGAMLPGIITRLQRQVHSTCADLVATAVRITVNDDTHKLEAPVQVRRVMHPIEDALRVQLDKHHLYAARALLAALSLLYTAAASHIDKPVAEDVRSVPLLLDAVHIMVHADPSSLVGPGQEKKDAEEEEGYAVAMAAVSAVLQQRVVVHSLGDGRGLRTVIDLIATYSYAMPSTSNHSTIHSNMSTNTNTNVNTSDHSYPNPRTTTRHQTRSAMSTNGTGDTLHSYRNQSQPSIRSPGSIIHTLHLVLSLALTHGGASALTSEGILQVFTNNVDLSSGGAVYHGGERTSWHQVWCLVVRVVTALLTLDGHPSPRLRAQYTQFIMAHQTRVIHALTQPWQSRARPLTLGQLEETEHVSMLTYSLSRRHLLPSVLREAVFSAFMHCAQTLRHSHASVVVEKITPTERTLAGDPMTSAPPPSSPSNRSGSPSPSPSLSPPPSSPSRSAPLSPGSSALDWGQRVDHSVYSTLRCLLASVRILTLVQEEGIEAREHPGLLLELSTNQDEPSVLHALHCVDTCVDMFKKLASHAHAESVEGGARKGAPAERLRVVDAVCGAVSEALYVCLSHMTVYASPELHHIQLLPLERKALTELAVELPSTIDRLQTALERLSRHLPRDYMKRTSELVERIRSQT
eukprot:gb/GECH01001971.1/.p1 GENE.gb/GECH01001971.1/~~gb/GECH01001971.1/.p1  ORF type:complete len:1962 (+),score=289.97 gb/GECH01001971.1/:1-5886(+)